MIQNVAGVPLAFGDDLVFALELRGGRLTLQAWDRTRNLTRRVTAIEAFAVVHAAEAASSLSDDDIAAILGTAPDYSSPFLAMPWGP